MTTKEKIAVMQASEEGKVIQYEASNGVWVDCKSPVWNWGVLKYRIKPELKYRPYKDTDEMIADYDRRFPSSRPKDSMPFIWLQGKYEAGNFKLITGFFNTGSCSFVSMGGISKKFGDLFQFYTYLDGSPIGKVVEE